MTDAILWGFATGLSAVFIAWLLGRCFQVLKMMLRG
jgi:hypothetical protein